MKRRAMEFKFTKAVEEETGAFGGYASVFDTVDSYGTVLRKGAFTETLKAWKAKNRLPPMLWGHDPDEPIGLWEKMVEDANGLYAEGRILLEAGATERRAYEHLKAGSVSGLSIGFAIPKGGIRRSDDDDDVYEILNVDLWETSLTPMPANPDAQIDSVRSALSSPRDFERILREAGLSRSQARGLMAKGFSAIAQCEAEEGDDEVEEAIAAIRKFTDTLRSHT